MRSFTKCAWIGFWAKKRQTEKRNEAVHTSFICWLKIFFFCGGERWSDLRLHQCPNIHIVLFILNVHEFVFNKRNIMWMRLNKYDTLGMMPFSGTTTKCYLCKLHYGSQFFFADLLCERRQMSKNGRFFTLHPNVWMLNSLVVSIQINGAASKPSFYT